MIKVLIDTNKIQYPYLDETSVIFLSCKEIAKTLGKHFDFLDELLERPVLELKKHKLVFKELKEPIVDLKNIMNPLEDVTLDERFFDISYVVYINEEVILKRLFKYNNERFLNYLIEVGKVC